MSANDQSTDDRDSGRAAQRLHTGRAILLDR
jgi:hypothetical protein